MIRGTTPTVTISVGTDLTGWDVFVTFESTKGQLTKSGNDLAVTPGDTSTVDVPLTQEDTLSFPEGRTVKVQLCAVKDGQRIATKVGEITASEVLYEGVLPPEV